MLLGLRQLQIYIFLRDGALKIVLSVVLMNGAGRKVQ
jgi:hypothetical protein